MRCLRLACVVPQYNIDFCWHPIGSFSDIVKLPPQNHDTRVQCWLTAFCNFLPKFNEILSDIVGTSIIQWQFHFLKSLAQSLCWFEYSTLIGLIQDTGLNPSTLQYLQTKNASTPYLSGTLFLLVVQFVVIIDFNNMIGYGESGCRKWANQNNFTCFIKKSKSVLYFTEILRYTHLCPMPRRHEFLTTRSKSCSCPGVGLSVTVSSSFEQCWSPFFQQKCLEK